MQAQAHLASEEGTTQLAARGPSDVPEEGTGDLLVATMDKVLP